MPQGTGRIVTVLRRGRLNSSNSTGGGGSLLMYGGSGAAASAPSSAVLNGAFSRLFLQAYLRLCYTVKGMMPCHVC